MTRLAREHDAINLAQGFPNFPTPEVLKEAAVAAIRGNINQYAITWGAKRLRDALAAKYAEWYGMTVNPETELTVTCGATEAMAATLLAIVDPGDEVIVPEPFYENYGPDAILCQARPVYLPLAPGQALDLDRLAAAFSSRTRAIIVNTPNNPTGHVFTRPELEAVARLCQQHDAYAVTDEIYEHIRYTGEHLPIATLPGMAERTVTISGASKTFSVTGWRVGWIIAPPEVTDAIRKVHDFLTVGAPAPLQEAVAAALESLPPEFYRGLAGEYRARRDLLCSALVDAGFRVTPSGWRLLRAGRLLRPERPGRRRLQSLADARGGRGPRTGIKLLPGSGDGPEPRAVRLLQDGGDVEGSGGPAAHPVERVIPSRDRTDRRPRGVDPA